MEFDIKTLTFVLLFTSFIQSIVFLLIILTTKKYKGTTLWAIGACSMTLGFGTLFLRSINFLDPFIILGTNIFIIGGLVLFYIGSKQFLDRPRKNRLLISSFVLFLFFIFYYTFIDNLQRERLLTFSLSAVIIQLLNANILLRYSKRSYRNASILVSSIFLIDAALLLVRMVYHVLLNDHQISFYEINPMMATTVLFSIGLELIWTFGLILIVNQRLSGELAESKSIFEAIFNNIPDGIVISDLQELRFLSVNPSFAKICGYTQEEILNDKYFVFKLWKDIDNYDDLKEEMTNKGHYYNHEVTFWNRNGEERSGLLSSTMIRLSDRDCMLTIGRDVTEQKHKEVELAGKTRELEKMVLEKDKFFSILAHDLRGSVSTAVNLTEIMTEPSNNFSNDFLQDMAAGLNKSVNSTMELLENLLEWTGLHRGMKNFDPKPICFGKLMEHNMSYLLLAAKDKDITLINEISDDTRLYADEHMIQATFRNLVANSIKFTRNGGQVRLSVRTNHEGQTVFSVSDNGIGMDKHLLESLFRVDVRNNRSGTNGELSSGLGLMLCKEFVEKHGGKIWVESEVNKGSTFSFTLNQRRQNS